MFLKLIFVHSLSVIYFLSTACGIQAAEPKVEKEYTLPQHGVLKLRVPYSWRDKVRHPANDLPPTIIFGSNKENLFSVLITPLWSPTNKKGFNSPEYVRERVRMKGDRLLPTAVETELTLKELHGKSATGYFYSFTDKAPKPGEYKYLTQGTFAVGDLLVVFTILTNEKNSPIVEDALKMFSTSEHKKETPGTVRGRPSSHNERVR